MRVPLAHLRGYWIAYLTAILVVGLIAADMLSSPRSHGTATAQDEVQNYVLFTTVTARGVSVTTGTQFASTTDRRIVAQWCYLTRDAIEGTLIPRLTIATVSASGDVTRAPVSSAALSAFGFDPGDLDTLVTSDCRFQRD